MKPIVQCISVSTQLNQFKLHPLAKATTGLLVLLAILLLGLAFWGLFFKQDNFKTQRIETILLRDGKGDIRSKATMQFAWNPIERSEKLAFGDSLFTGDLSNAHLVLPSGNELELGPLTMIKMRDRNNLKLDKGSLKLNLKADSPFVLSFKNKNIKLSSQQGSVVEITKSLKDKAQIKVKSGKVVIQSGAKTFLLNEGQNSDLLAERKVTFDELPKIQGPRDDVMTVYEDQFELTFAGPLNRTVEIEITNERGQILEKRRFNDKTSVELKSFGQLYWRARFSEEGKEYEYTKFENLEVSRGEFNYEDAEVIELKRPSQWVKFEWNESDRATTFILSKDPQFKTEYFKSKVTQRNQFVKIEDLGTYYWKLSGSKNKVHPKKVIITKTPPPSQPPRPKDIKKILKMIRPVFWKAYAGKRDLTLNLPTIEEAKLYEVEIYLKDELVYKKQLSSPKMVWSPPKEETYTYRFRYLDYWQRWSPFSEEAEIEVIKPQKKLTEKPTKKVIPPSKAKPKIKVSRPHTISVGPQFSNITLETSNDYNYTIEGVALGGHYLHYRYIKSMFYQVLYSSQYGTVFDDQDFNIRSTHLNVGWNILGKVFLGPAFVTGQLSSFEVRDLKIQTKELTSFSDFGAQATLPISVGKRARLLLQIAYFPSNIARSFFSVSTWYRWSRRIILDISLSTQSQVAKAGEIDFNLQSYQLLIGPIFRF